MVFQGIRCEKVYCFPGFFMKSIWLTSLFQISHSSSNGISQIRGQKIRAQKFRGFRGWLDKKNTFRGMKISRLTNRSIFRGMKISRSLKNYQKYFFVAILTSELEVTLFLASCICPPFLKVNFKISENLMKQLLRTFCY